MRTRSHRGSLLLLALLAGPLAACHRARATCPVGQPGPAVFPSVCGPRWPAYAGNPSLGPASRLLDDIERHAAQRLSTEKDKERRMAWLALQSECRCQEEHGRTCTRYTCHQLYERVWTAGFLAAAREDPKAAFEALHHAD